MRNLLYIFILVLLGSCSSSRSTIDYSKPATEPLQLIQSYLQSDSDYHFKVDVINSHGGRFILGSNIKKIPEGTELNTQTKNSSGQEWDTTMVFHGNEFLKKIEHELTFAESQIVIAGNYQSIIVTNGKRVEEFFTRRGIGLLHLLSTGESNIQKN